jgi:hypothetical protein
MKHTLIRHVRIACLAACCVFASCAQEKSQETSQEKSKGTSQEKTLEVVGEKGQSDATIAALQELTVRYVVATRPESGTVFVAFGSSPEDRADPPAGFLARLTDAGVTFAPVSALPAGENSHPLLVVHDVRWEKDGEALVSITRVRLGAGAADGFTARAVWADGAWTIEERTASWST